MSEDERFTLVRLCEEFRKADMTEAERLAELLWPGADLRQAIKEYLGDGANDDGAGRGPRRRPADVEVNVSTATTRHIRHLLEVIESGHFVRWLADAVRVEDTRARAVTACGLAFTMRHLTWAIGFLLRRCERLAGAAGRRTKAGLSETIAQLHEGKHPDYPGQQLSFGKIPRVLVRLDPTWCKKKDGSLYSSGAVKQRYRRWKEDNPG
jgi:hypothetical protein